MRGAYLRRGGCGTNCWPRESRGRNHERQTNDFGRRVAGAPGSAGVRRAGRIGGAGECWRGWRRSVRWRLCGLAFLEAQTWSQSLEQWPSASAVQATPSAAVETPPPRSDRMQRTTVVRRGDRRRGSGRDVRPGPGPAGCRHSSDAVPRRTAGREASNRKERAGGERRETDGGNERRTAPRRTGRPDRGRLRVHGPDPDSGRPGGDRFQRSSGNLRTPRRFRTTSASSGSGAGTKCRSNVVFFWHGFRTASRWPFRSIKFTSTPFASA